MDDVVVVLISGVIVVFFGVIVVVVALLLQSQIQPPSHHWSCTGLSLTSSTYRRPVKRIAIIGAGISGLAVTHALINHVNHQPSSPHPNQPSTPVNNQYQPTSSYCYDAIDVFDARPKLDETAGAGIQLNGGLSILGKINPELQDAVYRAGMPQTQIQSRTNPWFTATHSSNSTSNSK